MKSATIAQFRNGLSSYLRDVERGERVVICRRKRIIAELRPCTNAAVGNAVPQEIDEKLLDLEREGFLRRGREPLPKWCLVPIPGPKMPLLDALLDEREDGR